MELRRIWSSTCARRIVATLTIVLRQRAAAAS
jgi:hypothetical protein